jgi:signal transduction histidine kinase
LVGPHLARVRQSRARRALGVRGAEWVVAAVVLALVVLTLGGSVQALRAERAGRATAARALRDYASIAAWHYAQAAQAEFHDAAQELARPLDSLIVGPSKLPRSPEVLLPVERYSSRRRLAALTRFAFRLDVERGELHVAGGVAPATMQRWLRARLPAIAAAGGPDTHGSVIDTAGGQSWSVYYQKIGGRDGGAARMIFGVVADGVAATERLAVLHRATELLPVALAGPAPQHRLVGIRVLHPGGQVLYAAGPQTHGFAVGQDTMVAEQGGYIVVATLSAALARSSLFTASQGPVWNAGVTFVLALLLAAIALAQLRRSRELVQLREQFVAGVSHELRTPLTQISMFGETLMHGRERSVEERRHFAGVIFREARRLAALVENVLRFSAQGATTRIERCALDVGEELREAIAAFAPIAAAAGVRIEADVARGLRIAADAAALRQIVLNLLDNAVKYGPRAQRVRVSAIAEGDRVRMAVDDEGPGIAAVDRERAFDPFVRLARAGLPVVAGTGIGLAVVRQLAHAMDGTAHVEDAPGGGARFVITLHMATRHASTAGQVAP